MYLTSANPMQSISAFNPALGWSNFAQAWNAPMMSGQGAFTYAFNPATSSFQPVAWGGFPAAQSLAWSQPLVMGQPMGLSQTAALPQPMGITNQPALTSSVAGGVNLIHSVSGLAQPRVELSETNSDVVVVAELPNVNPNNLSLTVTDDSLSISALAFAGGMATSLHRTVALPTNIKAEYCDASYNNGILEARLPKSDIASRRRIRVNPIG